MPGNSEASAPSLVTLLICDQVIDDRLTGKKSAIGLFNRVNVPKVPAQIPLVTVMATLTEIRERCPLELRLLRDADNAVLIGSRGFVDAPDPLAMVDLVFALQGVRVPSEGQYAFELLAEGELLGRRRFHVMTPASESSRST